jgi:D-sedoheptulose 7-phosphate isomerase
VVKRGLLDQIALCASVADRLIEAFRAERKVLLFGNGGSAGDAEHIAGELLGKYYLDRAPLPAHALSTHGSALTAIANDYDYSQVFARQIEAIGSQGDVAIAISTSGNSPNVVEGARAARGKGLLVVALTGADGGQLKSEVDYCIQVPSIDTPRIQEAHMLIGHIWSELVEAALFGDSSGQ